MARFRFYVTYSAEIDTGEVSPDVLQSVLEQDEDYSLFEFEDVVIEDVRYEDAKAKKGGAV